MRNRIEANPRSEVHRQRLALGLTQAQAADRLGISLGWYATIEKAPSLMSERLAARLADVFGAEVKP